MGRTHANDALGVELGVQEASEGVEKEWNVFQWREDGNVVEKAVVCAWDEGVSHNLRPVGYVFTTHPPADARWKKTALRESKLWD